MLFECILYDICLFLICFSILPSRLKPFRISSRIFFPKDAMSSSFTISMTTFLPLKRPPFSSLVFVSTSSIVTPKSLRASFNTACSSFPLGNFLSAFEGPVSPFRGQALFSGRMMPCPEQSFSSKRPSRRDGAARHVLQKRDSAFFGLRPSTSGIKRLPFQFVLFL